MIAGTGINRRSKKAVGPALLYRTVLYCYWSNLIRASPGAGSYTQSGSITSTDN